MKPEIQQLLIKIHEHTRFLEGTHEQTIGMIALSLVLSERDGELETLLDLLVGALGIHIAHIEKKRASAS
jgi:hypothetical protein